MGIKKTILSVIGIVTLLCLISCTEKEQKYVSIENPEEYYILDGENYTYHNGEDDKVEVGTISKNDDETSISFVNSETNDTQTYEFRGDFFGSYMFDVDKSEVFDKGKKFKFEKAYDTEQVTVADMSFDWTKELQFELDGTFIKYTHGNGKYFVGTYSVDGNIITMVGIEGRPNEETKDETYTMYYNNYEFFRSDTFVKEK